MSDILSKEKSVEKIMNDVSLVVKDHFSKLIIEMNEENKTVKSTIDYLKNMPIVLKLEKQLKEANEEIARLRKELNKHHVPIVKLETEEINNNISDTNYAEISKLVTKKVNEKEKDFQGFDFASYYMDNQEDDDDVGDDVAYTEKKTPIQMPSSPYKQFLGLPNLNLDCDSQEDNTDDSEEEYEQDENDEEIVDDQDDECDEDEEIVEEDEDEDEDGEDVVEESSEEEEEVEEIEIDGKMFFTTDDKNGKLYAADEDGDPGDEVGYLKNGKAFFS